MKGKGRKSSDGTRKTVRQSAKASASAAGAAAKKGATLVTDNAPDYETTSKWLVRVVSHLPKYLRLYFVLLTDNRVSSKAKVAIVTAVAILGAQFALGGLLYKVQAAIAYVFGPLAFLPTIIVLLFTLDICCRLIDADVLDEYEKQIFGTEDSVAADVARLREYLGSSYMVLKAWVEEKADRAERELQEQGLIVQGRLTDDAIQEVCDQIVEMETSDKLHRRIDKNVKLLTDGNNVARDARKALEQKLLEE